MTQGSSGEMSTASLKEMSLRGVTKRKGTHTHSRVFTRSRSKVEKIRESLKHLKLEEKQIKSTRNKVFRGDPGSQDWSHDLDVRIGDQEISVRINKLPLAASALKRRSCPKHIKAEESGVNSESLYRGRSERSKSKCDSSGSRPGMLNNCSEIKDQFLLKEREQLKNRDSDWNDDCQTPESCSSMSDTIGIVNDSLKRKCGNDLQETTSKNFKGKRDQWQSGASNAGPFKESHTAVIGESDIAQIDKDQCSPSPPNSPLYDMPPPSTPAQKQARREKRHLQLERWKKYEATRSRQERYQRRAQEAVETMQKSVLMDSRRVQWSDDLVHTVYINNPDDEPNLMDSLMV